MSEHNISIKGGKTIRLKTAGKYCDRDIVVNAPDNLDALINNTITEVDSNAETIPTYKFQNCSALTRANFPNANAVGAYAFAGCELMEEATIPNLKSVEQYVFRKCGSLGVADFPEATSIATSAFRECSALHTVNMPKLEAVGSYAFDGCESLTRVEFPAAATVESRAFYGCTSLQVADFASVTSIKSQAFYDAAVKALVLRAGSVCTLSTNVLTGTPIASGTGYIYVPAALVGSYKTATNWIAHAAQFRALEGYTVDGTVTGELDESKMFGGNPIA